MGPMGPNLGPFLKVQFFYDFITKMGRKRTYMNELGRKKDIMTTRGTGRGPN